jgi:transposase
VAQRTAQINQVRGLLMEYGIVLAQGRAQVRKQLPWILEDAENGLSLRLRSLLSGIYAELIHLDERIANLDQEIGQIAVSDERCRRLLTIPGVGPITATALIAAIGDIETFKNGRELAAWLGLVPRQYSTGGKDRLLGISKRGDVYVRQLLIHGARSVLRFVDKKTDTRSRWAQSLIQRRNKNIAAVAMANKMARTVYALLKYEQDYQSNPVAV